MIQLAACGEIVTAIRGKWCLVKSIQILWPQQGEQTYLMTWGLCQWKGQPRIMTSKILTTCPRCRWISEIIDCPVGAFTRPLSLRPLCARWIYMYMRLHSMAQNRHTAGHNDVGEKKSAQPSGNAVYPLVEDRFPPRIWTIIRLFLATLLAGSSHLSWLGR